VPDLAGRIGLAMMVAGVVMTLAVVLSVVPRLFGVRRRALALRLEMAETRRKGMSVVARVRAQRAETAALLVPWRRLLRQLRWLRHPLVLATLDWHRRRRARR
jgi:hypothetical protein